MPAKFSCQPDWHYVSREALLILFANCYEDWLTREGDNGLVLVGQGFSGKSAFIENDVRGYISDRMGRGGKGGPPRIVHVDYDTFTEHRERDDVHAMKVLRNQLHIAGIHTPTFDIGLDVYDEKTDGKPTKAITAAGVANAAGVALNLVATIGPVIAAQNAAGLDGFAAVVAAVAGCIGPLMGKLSKMAHGQLRRSLEDPHMDETSLLHLLPILLADDLNTMSRQKFAERVGCIAVDSIGMGNGISQDCLELLLVGATEQFVLLGTRPAMWAQGDAMRVIDIDADDPEGVINTLLKDAGIDDGLYSDFLLHGDGGRPLSVGIARLCVAAVANHGRAELDRYVAKHNQAEQGELRVGQDADEITRDVLGILVRGLSSKDERRALYRLAWFGAVDLDLLQYEKKTSDGVVPQKFLTEASLQTLEGLPFVEHLPDGTWSMHAVIAHFLRVDCGETAASDLMRELQVFVKPFDGAGIAERAPERAMRGAIVRLQASAFRRAADSIQPCLDDATSLRQARLRESALPDILAKGSLGKWAASFGDALAPSDCSAKSREEFGRLLERYMEWNDSSRGVDPHESIDRAQEAADVAKGVLAAPGMRPGVTGYGELTTLYARALLRRGAISTDVYLHTGHVEKHHDGFRSERSAVHVLLDLPEDYRDWRFADAINSLAVSSYRLHGYEFSRRLYALSYGAWARYASDRRAQLDKIIRNWAAGLYACSKDLLPEDDSVSPFRPGDGAPTWMTWDPADLLDWAIDLCEASLRVNEHDGRGGREWPTRMTEAECELLGGNPSGALGILDDVWELIREAGQGGNAAHAGRCKHFRAQAHIALADGAQKDRDLRQEKREVSAALGDSSDALELRFLAGRFGKAAPDSWKSYRLWCDVKARADDLGLKASNAPGWGQKTVDERRAQKDVLKSAESFYAQAHGPAGWDLSEPRELTIAEREDLRALLEVLEDELGVHTEEDYKALLESARAQR